MSTTDYKPLTAAMIESSGSNNGRSVQHPIRPSIGNHFINRGDYRGNQGFRHPQMHYFNPEYSFRRSYFTPIRMMNNIPQNYPNHHLQSHRYNHFVSNDFIRNSISPNNAVPEGVSEKANIQKHSSTSKVQGKIEDFEREQPPALLSYTPKQCNGSKSLPQHANASIVLLKKECPDEVSIPGSIVSENTVGSSRTVSTPAMNIVGDSDYSTPPTNHDIDNHSNITRSSSPSTVASRPFSRKGIILQRMEHTKESKMSRLDSFESDSNDRIISFDRLSSHYPPVSLHANKRSHASVSLSSTSSSPATVPSIADESIEKEKKRSKKSNHDDRPILGNMNALCEAVSMVIQKRNEEKEIKHLIAMRSMDRVKSCSCPRSRCIKLYCECFQEGRMCSGSCSCKKCKNTAEESGPNGLRTKAINGILARNPRAFSKDSTNISIATVKPPQDELLCRCVKSQCLKLYCDCFQSGQTCGQFCMCVNCANTPAESGPHGRRTAAQISSLQRNPRAFQKKVKKIGECSCRNTKCLKKYCDCFSNGMSCTSSCVCIDCGNTDEARMKERMAYTMLGHTSKVVGDHNLGTSMSY
jgi:hypothetical protein